MACGQSREPMTKREGQTLLLFDSNQGYSRDISIRTRTPSLSCPPHPQTDTPPPFSLPISLCPVPPQIEMHACLRRLPMCTPHQAQRCSNVRCTLVHNSVQPACISCSYKHKRLTSLHNVCTFSLRNAIKTQRDG